MITKKDILNNRKREIYKIDLILIFSKNKGRYNLIKEKIEFFFNFLCIILGFAYIRKKLNNLYFIILLFLILNFCKLLFC